MQIAPFEPGMAAGVAHCYSDVMSAVPYCVPVDGDWFTDVSKLDRQPCREQSITVATEGEAIVGFAHAAVAAPATEQWHLSGEPGVIRFLACRPGQRPVGAALLDSAEKWLTARGCAVSVAADHRFLYPFYYLPFAHLSERLAHLTALLGMAGYSVSSTEILLDWPGFEPPRVRMPDLDVELAWKDEQVGSLGGPEVALHAMQHGNRVGECLMAHLSWDGWRPELAGICFCSSLCVGEELQGKGLGKYLLAQGLARMHDLGFRHAMISTDWDNYRAQLCYANLGYQFFDRTSGYRKQLHT
jgi:GNAT superfamily N-acetyltransferase